MKIRLPGRFEWKILAALFIIASLPLGAAAYLMSVTLGRISNITDQHQKEVQESLGRAVEVYRVYFAQMKDGFRERAAELAATPFERAADLANVPDLLRARVLRGDQVIDEWAVAPEIFEHAREAPPNLVELRNSPPGAPRLLELTFGISREMYANFLTLREAMNREEELDRTFPLIFPRIFHGLGLALVIILALATVLGMFVARRATGRVATLRTAAQRVGEGDLTVRVSPRGKDELDDLGRAFDRMVAELGETRSRLEYLQKVSAWQEVARRLAHEIKNPLTPIQLAVQELGSKYRGEDPAYARLLTTAQEILKEEIDSMRRLVDDFSAFAKLPKVEPAPVDLGQVVEDFVRGHSAWQPHLRFDKPAATGRGAVRSHADPPRAHQPGRERHPGAPRGSAASPRSCCASPPSARTATRIAGASTSSSTTTAPACRRRRASGSSTPTSRPRRTAPAWAWRSCARSSSTTAATSRSPPNRRRWAARASRWRSPPPRQRLRLRLSGQRQSRTLRRFSDPVGQHGGRGGREPRLDAPAAHPAAQDPLFVDGERSRVQRLVAAVRQLQRHRAAAVEAQRPHDQRRVVDVDIGEAPLVEPQDVAAVVEAVEPAEEGAAQSFVTDRLTLVDELPFAIDPDPRAPQPLDELGVRLHAAPPRFRRPAGATRGACPTRVSTTKKKRWMTRRREARCDLWFAASLS